LPHPTELILLWRLRPATTAVLLILILAFGVVAFTGSFEFCSSWEAYGQRGALGWALRVPFGSQPDGAQLGLIEGGRIRLGLEPFLARRHFQSAVPLQAERLIAATAAIPDRAMRSRATTRRAAHAWLVRSPTGKNKELYFLLFSCAAIPLAGGGLPGPTSRKGVLPRHCRRGRTDPPGRGAAVPAHDASLARTLGVPPAAARRRHAAPRQLLSRYPHAERGHLRKGPGELAGTIVCSRCPPRTTPRALAACSAALVRSPIRRRSFSARAA
jgi:hypothetical protein